MPQKTATKHRWSVVGMVVLLLLGCPLYEEQCDGPSSCATGYYCSEVSLRCVPATLEAECARPEQCDFAETCAPDFKCRPGSCNFHGCVAGYACGIVDSAHACVLDAVNGRPPDSSDAAAGNLGDAAIEAGSSRDDSADAGRDAFEANP